MFTERPVDTVDKKAINELARKEADKLKRRFIANVSHELRTPANMIIGGIDLAMAHGIQCETQKAMLHLSKNSTLQLLRAVDDILHISSIEAGHLSLWPRAFSLNEILECALGNVRSQFGNEDIQIRYCVSSDIPEMIWGDSDILKKVISNILDNAIKFSPVDKYINIVIQAKYLDDQKMHLVCSIEDKGIGVSEEKQDVIFDMFSQENNSRSRPYDGLGLGLAIASKLVHAAGGEIWLESSEKGSVFYFTYPVQYREHADMP